MASFRVVKHKVPATHLREFSGATANSDEDVLQLIVNQYIPLDNPNPGPGDVTIIAAHAVGFQKELYEPLWDDLLVRAKRDRWKIRSIWMADVAWHGESLRTNEDIIANDPGWFDHSRDLMNLINVKRSEMPRPIIGVGHSMGGAQLVKLALSHPSLFTTLILLDPVVQQQSAEIGENTIHVIPSPAALSTFRRPTWPSRDVARTSFLKSPFYQAWDPRVFDNWIEYGLRDCPNPQFPDTASPQVSLATPPAQEVWSFLRPNYEGYGVNGKAIDRRSHPDLDTSSQRTVSPFYRSEAIHAYRHLPELRPSVLYIFAELSTTSDATMNQDKLKRTGTGIGGSGGVAEKRVKGVTLMKVGHLLAMEAPDQTADSIAEWVGSELKLYQEWRERFEKQRQSKTLSEKQHLDDRWITIMKDAIPQRKPKLTSSKI